MHSSIIKRCVVGGLILFPAACVIFMTLSCPPVIPRIRPEEQMVMKEIHKRIYKNNDILKKYELELMLSTMLKMEGTREFEMHNFISIPNWIDSIDILIGPWAEKPKSLDLWIKQGCDVRLREILIEMSLIDKYNLPYWSNISQKKQKQIQSTMLGLYNDNSAVNTNNHNKN